MQQRHLWHDITWPSSVRRGPGGHLPQSVASRLFVKLAEAIDRRWRWDRLPDPSVARPYSRASATTCARSTCSRPMTRNRCRSPTPSSRRGTWWRARRTAPTDDLSDPAMGMAGTGSQQYAPKFTEPEDGVRLMTPNPRIVSDTTRAGTADDSRHHTQRDRRCVAAVRNPGLVQPRQRRSRTPRSRLAAARRATTRRTRPSSRAPVPDDAPARRCERDRRRHSSTLETHWWDASPSIQPIKNWQQRERVPAVPARKLRPGALGRLRSRGRASSTSTRALLASSGGADGWWMGLTMLHTLFTREHNAICDGFKRSTRAGRTTSVRLARLINARALAKIHTAEWTTGVLPTPRLSPPCAPTGGALLGEAVVHNIFRAGSAT